jgi:phosphoribosylamine--glycine ligase
MARHNIPTARWRAARGASEARDILRGGEFGGADAPVVIKADGLAAGKGVVVARHPREAEEAVNELGGEEGAPQPLLIEEALAGREASLLLFADGRNYSLMPAARDHKRIGENDTGPNTGGMGAVTAPEVLDEATLARVKREIVEPTLDGARAENIPFRGILFIGLMLTADGPRVLEYNVRFGDPEAQAITVRLQSDLIEICESIVEGTLDRTTVRWSHDASACVVLAAPGYPASPVTGSLITGLERVRADHPEVHVFHAGTARGADGSWVTAGGRVLGVTATGPTLEEALSRCYSAVGEISWEGMQYRRDIGKFKV